MPEPDHNHKPVRVASVIASLTAGGIGPVCRYAAEGMAKRTDWRVTLVSLYDPSGGFLDEASGLRVVCLGLKGNVTRLFLQWLAKNPQDLMITSDVSRLEPAFPYFPRETLHVIQMHDSSWRYLNVGIRNQHCVDGIVCVANHVEERLRPPLTAARFAGLLDTVHNGAAFPPPPARTPYSDTLRLVFMGRMDPFKGIFDLVPILQRLDKMKVPVQLTIVGGQHELLARRFKQKKLDHLVTWTGRVPHQDCYRLAAANDVFLMTSRKEPFGMVTIEAMSMGCVPLAYDIPSGSTEIIEDGKSGLLVALGNFHAWAQFIKMLHEDRRELLRLSQGASERARTHFNETTMAAKLCAFLERVRGHAQTHPCKREAGVPPESRSGTGPRRSYYQRLSPAIREWVRNRVGASPRLSYWLLNHWNQ